MIVERNMAGVRAVVERKQMGAQDSPSMIARASWFISRQRTKIGAWLGLDASQKFDALLFGIDEIFCRLEERLRGLEFGGYLGGADLAADTKFSETNAQPYGPIRPYRLRKLIAECYFEKGAKFDRFVDVGCGKGLPPIVVARATKIPDVLGVDLSGPLIEVANRNKAKLGLRHVHFAKADALEYRIPDGDTIVYLYNPFNQSILKPFLENNMDHFRKNKSVIAYAYDRHRDVLLDMGFDVVYRSQWYNMAIFKLRTAKVDG